MMVAQWNSVSLNYLHLENFGGFKNTYILMQTRDALGKSRGIVSPFVKNITWY